MKAFCFLCRLPYIFQSLRILRTFLFLTYHRETFVLLMKTCLLFLMFVLSWVDVLLLILLQNCGMLFLLIFALVLL